MLIHKKLTEQYVNQGWTVAIKSPRKLSPLEIEERMSLSEEEEMSQEEFQNQHESGFYQCTKSFLPGYFPVYAPKPPREGATVLVETVAIDLCHSDDIGAILLDMADAGDDMNDLSTISRSWEYQYGL